MGHVWHAKEAIVNGSCNSFVFQYYLTFQERTHVWDPMSELCSVYVGYTCTRGEFIMYKQGGYVYCIAF